MTSGSFPILQLPTEIRLSIYNLILPHSEYHQDSDHEKIDCPVTWYPGICPNILFVNRQIYQEASEILYRDNVFSIYVRHPRNPRLPMNESRADPESFLLISWAGRDWSNPKNPRLPYPILQRHFNFQNVRNVHISTPPFGDLLGINVYLQRSSYAAFNGINAWVNHCVKAGGTIDEKDSERMAYVQQFKEPIDQIAQLLQTLPRIENLHLSIQVEERLITFVEYMLQRVLALRNVNHFRAFYVSQKSGLHHGNPGPKLLESLTAKLGKPLSNGQKIHTSPDLNAMFWVLQSVKEYQRIDPADFPTWLFPIID